MTDAAVAAADRTLRYTRGFQPTKPAGSTSGRLTTASLVGQVAILTAVNITARVHPGIVLAVPDTPLMVTSPTGGDTLVEACCRLASAANPAIDLRLAHRIADDIPSVGIGGDARPASVYAGGAGWTAHTGGAPQDIAPQPSSLLGTGLAVTLATSYVFRTSLGWPAVRDRGVSLWSLSQTRRATGRWFRHDWDAIQRYKDGLTLDVQGFLSCSRRSPRCCPWSARRCRRLYLDGDTTWQRYCREDGAERSYASGGSSG